MKSPITRKAMERITLLDKLSAYQCLETKGIFIPVTSYLHWLSKQSEKLPHLPDHTESESTQEATVDSDGALICPESGQLMLRYKVGHGFSFFLNRSPSGSIWLDKGEWDQLLQRQFHDELHLIFTSPWQQQIRDAEKQATHISLLTEQLGSDLVEKLDNIKQQLTDQQLHSLAIAYLSQEPSH